MFGFYLDKGLISPNQSGFKPGDTFINQFLSITHNICKSFDDVVLTFQKRLIKSGKTVIISKLQENGISGNLLKVLKYFLINGKQELY